MTLEMRDQNNRDIGREEGRQEIRVENAQKMLALGMEHKLIAEISGLRIEEVEELAQPQPV